MERENLRSSEVDKLLLESESEDECEDDCEGNVVLKNHNDDSPLADLSTHELDQLLEAGVIDVDFTKFDGFGNEDNENSITEIQTNSVENSKYNDEFEEFGLLESNVPNYDGTNGTEISFENEMGQGDHELQQHSFEDRSNNTDFDINHDEIMIENIHDTNITTVTEKIVEMGQGEPSTSNSHLVTTTRPSKNLKRKTTSRPNTNKIKKNVSKRRKTKKSCENDGQKKVTKKKKKFCDSDWPWLDTDNEPKKIDFKAVPGIDPLYLRRLGDSPTELHTFMQIFGEELWEMICLETNDYAEKQINNAERTKLKSDEKWQKVTTDELKAYFALYINMGQIKKPTLKQYWSHRKILETPIFSQTMSFERFTAISRFLHFYDEEIEENTGDRLKKIRPVIRYLETKFLQMYEPEKHLALDETLLKMRARLGIIQFNPKKRARFGVKIYKVCESSSGYCSVFKIYVGSDKVDDLLASESVVLDLMEPFFHKGYIVYLDNWYTSPLLYTKLLDKDTYAVGTALSVRKCMPRIFLTTELELGEAIRRSGRGVLAVKWKDRKDVHMLSTVHEGIEKQTSKVVRLGDSNVEVIKPKSVIDYNHGMLGVDRQDQVLSSFPIMRRTIKAYKKIFFYLVDMAIFNAFCLHKKITKKQMHFTEFRLNLVEQLLQTVTLPARTSPGRAPLTDNPLRLQAKNWGHFLIQIPPTPCKNNPTRSCKVCKSHKIRSETRYMCEKCGVALHLEKCFKDYHMKVKY